MLLLEAREGWQWTDDQGGNSYRETFEIVVVKGTLDVETYIHMVIEHLLSL